MERVMKEHGGGPQAEDVILAMRRIVRRLLHVPTVRARELAPHGRQHDYAAALEALFGLSIQAAAGRAGTSGSTICPARTGPGGMSRGRHSDW